MNIVITGAGAGLGQKISVLLHEQRDSDGSFHNVYQIDRKWGFDVRLPQGGRLNHSNFADDEKYACPQVSSVDVLINCAGVNNIAWFEDVDDKLWDETLDINAKSIWKMTEYYLESLAAAKGTVLNIVSNASHMPMRCSLAYNASKGAAHIMTLQMARELYGRHGITVFGISPNKLKGTEMSADIDRQVCETRGWTPEQAQAYQLQGLATQTETDPATLAEFIVFLLSSKERHRYLHGCIIPYGA